MRITKLKIMLLCSLSLAVLLNGCGSSSRESSGSPADVARVDETVCAQCHATAVSKVTGSPLYTDYIASMHNSVPDARAAYPTGIGCQGCHGGGAQHNGIGPLPYPDPSAAGMCFGCHKPAFLSGAYSGGAPVTAHYYTVTDASVAPMYVSRNYENKCTACHDPHKADIGIGQEHTDWAASGHGDVNGIAFTAYDFKNYSNGDCTPCHTSTGNINYVNAGFVKAGASWAVAGDKSREVITCEVCHTSFDFKNRVRGLPGVKAMYTFGGAPVVFNSVGASNLCVVCHSGRGNSDTARSSRFQGHHAGAAGILFSSQAHLGYEYTGKNYANGPVFAHEKLGTAAIPAIGSTGNGPCVTCHMSSANSHRYATVTKNPGGTITGITTSVCVNCHAVGMTATDLETLRKGYLDAGALLGTYVSNTITNYLNVAITSANYATVAVEAYGAYQNSQLTSNEIGAYVHNSTYAKRLIFDSIDWMDNGVLNGTITIPPTSPDARVWLNANAAGVAARP